MEKKATNAPNAPQPIGAYSQAVEIRDAKRMLYISGQVPQTATGEIPVQFSEQARLAWNNIRAQLEAAGMTTANLVKVTTFLSSRDFADENGEARRAALGQNAPALTVIICEIFDPRWLLEIEAIAVD